MPIDPRFAILLLDAGVYKVSDQRGTVSIKSDDDIQGLNTLQYLNADKTIYFPAEYLDHSLERLLQIGGRQDSRFSFLRAENGATGGVYIPTDKDEFEAPSKGVDSELVMISSVALEKDIRFYGLGMKLRKTFHDDGSIASPLRDPIWTKIVKDFSLSVRNGDISYTDLPTFLAEHPLRSDVGPIMKAEIRRRFRKKS